MNIIIIEDDENKRYQLKQFVDDLLPESTAVVNKSLQSGLRSILENNFDLILLDMTMPTYDIDIEEDGGRTQPLEGRESFFQMERRDIQIPVIVVTQFDRFGTGKDSLTLKELDLKLREEHPTNYRGYVYYNTALEGWKEDLKYLIRKTIQSKGNKIDV